MRRSLLLLVVMFLLPASAHAATVTVPIAGDTFVRSDLPNDSFNSTNPLQLDGSPIRRPLLWFQNVPTNGTAATLRLHSEWHTSEPFEVHLSSCDWSGSVTYNTAPPVGALLATVPDDPVGWIDIPIPASQLTAETCLAITKTGDNWTDISSKDSSYGAQLVVDTAAPPPPPPPPPDTSPVAKCGGTPVNATPSNIASVIASRDSVTINAAPGSYGDLGLNNGVRTCVEIHCTVSAYTGETPNSNGCRETGNAGALSAIKNLTIEGFEFVGTGDYGLAIYDESPNVGMKVRIANNVFKSDYYHDISTKVRVAYTEVVSNLFVSCMRHCWEIGQNENLTSRPSTTDTSVFKNNIVSSRGNGLTNRSNINLIVTGNTFRSVNYAIQNWPLWYATNNNMVPAVFQTGSLQILNPYPPLRTTVTGNTFTGSNVLRFEGRGTTDDVVLLKDNTGTTPSCVRASMDSDEAATYYNEQTSGPPKLDPASDIPC